VQIIQVPTHAQLLPPTTFKRLQLRFDYDTTTTHRTCLLPFNASKKWTCQFFVVVVSHSNRNCDIGLKHHNDKDLQTHHRLLTKSHNIVQSQSNSSQQRGKMLALHAIGAKLIAGNTCTQWRYPVQSKIIHDYSHLLHSLQTISLQTCRTLLGGCQICGTVQLSAGSDSQSVGRAVCRQR